MTFASCLAKCLNSVLNVEAQVGNQEAFAKVPFQLYYKHLTSNVARDNVWYRYCVWCVYPFQVKSNHNFCIFCVFSWAWQYTTDIFQLPNRFIMFSLFLTFLDVVLWMSDACLVTIKTNPLKSRKLTINQTLFFS